MNGAPDGIQIFKPFEEAFAVTKKILFQPFDLKKWLVIGFAAWLANLGLGGRGGTSTSGKNGNQGYDISDWRDFPWVQNVIDTFHQIPFWIVLSGLIALIIAIFALMILLAWLRARGSFMFVDCIVKNRGAIVEPWREFRKQGNSYFLFGLLIGIIMLVILSIAAVPFILPVIKGMTFEHPNVYFIIAIACWALVLVGLILAWSIISHFMVAIMYRRRCLAREAFATAVSLIANYPGEITLYCLFWIVLAIAAAITSCITILATCCIAILPYIGTVILLPLFVCLRAFGLRFIQQFGPDYDVWAGIPPSPPPPLPS